MKHLVRLLNLVCGSTMLLVGSASAATVTCGSVSNTGSGSTNTVTCVSTNNVAVSCVNNVIVANTNGQTSTSGGAFTTGNTVSGGSSSGSASNSNTVAVRVGASCAPASTAAATTPGSGGGGSGSGSGAGATAVNPSASVASLPDTGSNTAEKVGIASVAALGVGLALTQSVVRIYRRTALK